MKDSLSPCLRSSESGGRDKQVSDLNEYYRCGGQYLKPSGEGAREYSSLWG